MQNKKKGRPAPKKPAKRTSAPRKKLALVRSPSQNLGPMAHKVCSLTDPFCVHANGAKYPDASSIRTLPYTYKGRSIFGTTSSGEISILFNPTYSFQPFSLAATGVVPAVTSWTNTSVQAGITGVSSYRMISVGFKITVVASKFTSAGLLSLRTYGNESISALSTVDISTFNASETMDIPIPEIRELCVILPHTAQMPQLYFPVANDSNNISTSTPKGFQPATIYISGAPNGTSLINIEYIINYELVFEDNSGMAQLATPSAKGAGMLTALANQVSASAPSFFEKGAKFVGDYIYKKAVTAVAARFGGPVGAGVAHLALEVD